MLGELLKTHRAAARRGFTVVEIVIVITVIAILAAIGTTAYGGIQRRSDDSTTQKTVSDAFKTLQLYYVNNKNYPSNIANTDYIAPDSVYRWRSIPMQCKHQCMLT